MNILDDNLLLKELIDVRIENIQLKKELIKEKKETCIISIINIILVMVLIALIL
jgi:hypothetical protein